MYYNVSDQYATLQKTQNGQREKMRWAVVEVIGGKAVNTVAQKKGLDRMTLKRYVRKVRVNPNIVCKPQYVTKQVFAINEEMWGCAVLRSRMMWLGNNQKQSQTQCAALLVNGHMPSANRRLGTLPHAIPATRYQRNTT